ncbi:MAG: GNAT family N-acetyltransferase [Anaerolineales bacterium]
MMRSRSSAQGRSSRTGRDLELASIAVRPEYQGQGIAALVIEYLLKDSPRPLYLTCVSRMGAFYQKFGLFRWRMRRCRAIND